MEPFKKLFLPIIIFWIIVSVGIFGYRVIENWSLLDAVYMVIITLFTVGFQEVQPLSSGGKIFTIFLILSGVGAAIYVAGQIIEIIVEGQILAGAFHVRFKIEIRSIGDAFEFLPADRKLIFDVRAAFRVVRELVGGMGAHSEMFRVDSVVGVPTHTAILPVFEPGVVVSRFDEKFEFHLFELPGSKHEVARSDLVAKRFSDLTDAERRASP